MTDGLTVTEPLHAIIEENAQARAELIEAIDALPARRRLESAIDGWSVKDLVANIAAHQDGRAAILEGVARGEQPHMWTAKEVAALDAAQRLEWAPLSWEMVLARLRAARERFEAAVRALHVREAEVAPDSLAARIADLAWYERERAERIRAWRREQGL